MLESSYIKFTVSKTFSIYILIPIFSIYSNKEDYGKEKIIDVEFNTNIFIVFREDYFDFIFRILGFGLRIVKYMKNE